MEDIKLGSIVEMDKELYKVSALDKVHGSLILSGHKVLENGLSSDCYRLGDKTCVTLVTAKKEVLMKTTFVKELTKVRDGWKSLLDSIEKSLCFTQKQYDAAEIALFTERTGIKIGSVVEYHHQTYIITRFSVWGVGDDADVGMYGKITSGDCSGHIVFLGEEDQVILQNV